MRYSKHRKLFMVEQIKEKLHQGKTVFVMYEGLELFKMVPAGDCSYNRYKRRPKSPGSWLSGQQDTNLPIDDIPLVQISIYDDEDEAISDFNRQLQEQLEIRKREEKHFL